MSNIDNTSQQEELAMLAQGVSLNGDVPEGFMQLTVPLVFLDQLYPKGVPDEILTLSDTDGSPEGYVKLVLPESIATDVARIGLTSEWAVDLFPEGLLKLVQGYFDYAKLLLLDRAVPSIDGFKQSQRRIMYTLYANKVKVGGKVKSAKLATDTLVYHPHNDKVLYETFARYVNTSAYTMVPLLGADGSFGHRNVGGTLPAPRYNAVIRLPITERFFKELDGGVDYGRTEDDIPEPSLLPVQVPYGLFMPSVGVGLGAGSKFLSYNPTEVINYLLEVIDKGSTDTILVPDFPTGGYIRNNPKAFRKVMETGLGTVELTSRWYVDGNKIIFDQINFYTTVSKTIKEIEDLELHTISDVRDASGHDTAQPTVEITCKDTAFVDYTLKRILKETSLHTHTHANMLTVIDNQPRVVGVAEYVNEWLKFRSNVVKRYYSKQVGSIQRQIDTLEFIIGFTANQKVVQQFIDKIYKGRKEGEAFLRETYPAITKEQMEAVVALRISSLAEKDSRKTRLNTLKEDLIYLESVIKDPYKLIRSELIEIRGEIGCPRKTIITDEDFSYRKVEILTAEEDTSDTHYFIRIEDGFLFKHEKGSPECEGQGYWCKDEDYIQVIDKAERLIRVPVSDIPHVKGSSGLFVQDYAGFDIRNGGEDLLMFSPMRKDKEECLLYRDGYVSMIKHNEWLDAKYVTKVTRKGLPQGYGSELTALIDVRKEYHVVQTTDNRIVVFPNDFKHKERTARTKVVAGLSKRTGEQVVRGASVSIQTLLELFISQNPSDLTQVYRLCKYSENDFNYELFYQLVARGIED